MKTMTLNNEQLKTLSEVYRKNPGIEGVCLKMTDWEQLVITFHGEEDHMVEPRIQNIRFTYTHEEPVTRKEE